MAEIKYTIKSIETEYKGYKFRSRLEAKWACFFDLCRWKWEYEPVEFNGWFPDFALYGESQIIYVEIKPVIEFPKEIANKIDKSGCDKEVLILGQSCLIPNSTVGDRFPYFGWIREDAGVDGYADCIGAEEYDLSPWGWDEAVFGRWEFEKYRMGFCAGEWGSFRDRISGIYAGGCYGDESVTKEEVKRLWAEATNKTQWQKRVAYAR